MYSNLAMSLLSPLLTMFLIDAIASQTTVSPPTPFPSDAYSGSTIPLTTDFSPLVTDDGGTTLTAADSSDATTTVATESDDYETTTDGRLGRYESTRKPSISQEATTLATRETSGQKGQEKKVAWKFGRGGSGQEGWPNRNKAFPQWKKVTNTPSAPQVEQNNGVSIKNNKEQPAYIVWSVGQGKPPNGWTLGPGSEGWVPEGGVTPNNGWIPGDVSGGSNSANGGWNTDDYADDQASDGENTEDEWADDENGPEDDKNGGWTNAAQGAWNGPNNNQGGWSNNPPGIPVSKSNPSTPVGNAGSDASSGSWTSPVNDAQNKANTNTGGRWNAPQQGNIWPAQQPPTVVQQNTQNGWPPTTGGWTNPPQVQPVPVVWNNNAPSNGWANSQANQPNGGQWNSGGGKDAEVSWKVYNENTQTMEDMDDSSGWKVVEDEGTDSWKLINEKGNIEWKIENVNGEWRVISADEVPSQDNSTTTTEEPSSTTTINNNATLSSTSSPSGGWDDDKQGRYIIWKFSEDGKGEARVYGGDGSDPEIWTVGDNNQYWQQAVGGKTTENNKQASWKPTAGTSPAPDSNAAGNIKWSPNTFVRGGTERQKSQTQNSGQRKKNNNTPEQNGAWQVNGESLQPQVANVQWQSDGPTSTVNNNWQQTTNVSPPTKVKQQQTGNGSRKNINGWQQTVPAAPPTNQWRNVASGPQHPVQWQSQSPKVNGAWNTRNSPSQPTGGWGNTNNVRPSPPTQTIWQNVVAIPQPNAGVPNAVPVNQVVWQNVAVRQQSNSGWPSGQNSKKGRGKGKNRNQANGNINPSGWQQNQSTRGRKKTLKGPRNNKNGGSSWNQGTSGTPLPPPPAVISSSNGNAEIVTNWQNNGGSGNEPTSWSDDSSNSQPVRNNGPPVPYVIVIKVPESSSSSDNGGTNVWSNNNRGQTSQTENSNKNGNNGRRNNGWKMKKAGSSGWRWNPDGGSNGWKWQDGWMGSGGGFGGWMGDKGTMYSGWRPTNSNDGSSTSQTQNRYNKKGTGKMVFVFGSKRNAGEGRPKPSSNGKRKGKKIIILDYTNIRRSSGPVNDKAKVDVESVIQALRLNKIAAVQGTTTKPSFGGQKTQS